MSINEEFKEVEYKLALRIKNTESLLNNLKEDYEKITNAEKFETKSLFSKLESILSVDIVHGEYEHILGGDGRSMPWSEKRVGVIANVSFKGVYWFPNSQREMIEKYVVDVYDADDVRFV